MPGNKIVEVTLSHDRFESEILTEVVRAEGFQVELLSFQSEGTGVLEQPSKLLIHEADLESVQDILDRHDGGTPILLEPGFPKPLEHHELRELVEIPRLTFDVDGVSHALTPAHWEWWQEAEAEPGLVVATGAIATASDLGPALSISDPLRISVHSEVPPTNLLLMGHAELTPDGGPAAPDAPPLLIEADLMAREDVAALEVSYDSTTTFTVSLGPIASEIKMVALQLEWLLDMADFEDFELPLIRCTWAAML